MELIGKIKQVQVQVSSLKVGVRPKRYYDPTPLQPVPALSLSRAGVAGIADDGSTIIDVHNQQHPGSRNREGVNGISFNFTSHYQRMQGKFGLHLTEGIAGENILIECDQILQLDDLHTRLAIRSEATGELIYLNEVVVAAPCVEFSHFALNQADPVAESVKEALQFLDTGTRGFYATSEDVTALIRAGDSVFRLV